MPAGTKPLKMTENRGPCSVHRQQPQQPGRRPSRASDHDTAVTDAYLRGLRDLGWNGGEPQVRFASAATAALVTGSWCAQQVSEPCEQLQLSSTDEPTWPYQLAGHHLIDIDTALAGWAGTFTHLLDLSEIARELVAAG